MGVTAKLSLGSWVYDGDNGAVQWIRERPRAGSRYVQVFIYYKVFELWISVIVNK